MTCFEIYEMALPLIARERSAENDDNSLGELPDYSESVPKLINALSFEVLELAKIYATVSDRESGFAHTKVGLITDLFPLPERFVPAAVYYVAEKLSYKHSPETAKLLNTLYKSEIDNIRRELPAVMGTIVDNY